MARVQSEKIIAAIDIGTTKICVLIGRESKPNTIDIIGIGTAPSEGMKRGIVVDVTKTIAALNYAQAKA